MKRHKSILRLLVLVLASFAFQLSVCAETYIKIGIIGLDPVKKVQKRTPFVNYLVKGLRSEGITKGKIMVAEDIEQMIQLITSNKVDIFIDSPYPAVVVSKYSNTSFLVDRWKNGVKQYHSVIFVRKDSGVKRLDDLRGKMVAFENPWSTSGYFLPKVTMEQNGLKLALKKNRNSIVRSGETGFLYSDGDETTMIWVIRNVVVAGATDNKKFIEDARNKVDQLQVIHRTNPVPRHLVTHRQGLSPNLVKRVKKVLLEMHLSEEGVKILKGFGKTKKFSEISAESLKYLNELKDAVSID